MDTGDIRPSLSVVSVAGCLTDRAWVNVPSRSMGQASCRSADIPYPAWFTYTTTKSTQLRTLSSTREKEEEANTDGNEASGKSKNNNTRQASKQQQDEESNLSTSRRNQQQIWISWRFRDGYAAHWTSPPQKG
ncbi:hypothetical protein H113_07494 [Trichophyton rubrum MR1459]|nr:hypothetical protein H102_07415 [Trichophyton rubrum CBS 100081]EZF80925.1 hypothetical protein H110_07434 [Trichophyton rubrum MR1448]EZF91583.1 hypothetical protein H113_07494 [Trichophyton rubrum MR1459]EZG02665.1 hypothetical protein H106_07271 [Trichophyton rubrum CBS 735.88]EZG13016.1 hypothetical protein H107_07604 [Trichophyton rubrum CBS 202.88]